jgi:hypothetical protein
MACKGSWKDSARNIRYNGDTVECELKAKNGNWIKNKLKFNNNYLYHNNDGKFTTDSIYIFYQHNNTVIINKQTYTYVYQYKKQLLSNITRLLNDLQIKFVIAHGNLIEYERGKPIVHDDDIDIRIDKNDFYKWIKFLKNCKSPYIYKYNLMFDNLINGKKYITLEWLHCRLIKFTNNGNIKEFNNMDIQCDLVTSASFDNTWIEYNINFNKLRSILYLDVNTFAPSVDDTVNVLSSQYGKNYLIPNEKSPF